MMLPANTTRLLLEVANEVQADPEDLKRLIAFESGWSPTASNPYSSAKGLIQFIDATARDLGYADSADLVAKNPTAEDQLRSPVRDYLKRYAPFKDKQALYMAVFFPAAMNWPPDQKFPDYVPQSNPDIYTPRDYMNKIESWEKANPDKIPQWPMWVAWLAGGTGIAFLLWYLNRTKKG